SLVETEPPVAVKFIRKLAEVYRYVLDMRDRELVMLSEELSLVHSFLFMQRYRFGDNLQVTIGPMNPAARVVPLSVQMLVENALKHNVVTDHQPLALTLVEEDGWLVCRNNFQPRELIEPSSGTGLQNIAGRLAPFTTRVMTWGVESNCFTVRMPLV
ncbi:MAG: histidine kinase, partial [Bacteroidales bacterium]|nr:histidine kinase [Bacteroidales bacterium]